MLPELNTDFNFNFANQIADHEQEEDVEFRNFQRHMLHTTLEAIFETLCPAMSKPKAKLCADGHYRRAIYGLGPYIADYPEQVLLACIVQGWCPMYVFHNMILNIKL